MQELRWMEPLPDHTLEGGLRLLDELRWSIKVTEADQHWYINGGHVRLLKASSRESEDAFSLRPGAGLLSDAQRNSESVPTMGQSSHRIALRSASDDSETGQ